MHLRCELRGHEQDVRGICVCPLGIVSVSRDKTVKIWKEASDSEYTLDKTLAGHEDFVVTVVWIEAGLLPDFPQGTIATGSKDKTVIIWDIDNEAPAFYLADHTQQVSALGILSDATLVSASVDGTLKLWQNGQCTNTLEGHEASVLSLLVLPDDYILSGSVDKTIRLWKDGSCVSVFSGHSDTVRDLTLAPNLGVISASHDSTLRLWSLDGSCMTTYEGHSEIVYTCAFSPNRLIASGSEDGTAKLWDVSGKCLKSIYHPGNIWAVAFLPNNDLITACSDGVVRIFSEDENRLADPEVRQVFEAAVNMRREELLASRKGTLPPGMKIEDPSILYMPGSKDGDTRIVAEGLGACAYAWSAAEQEWKKIGDVLGTQPGELASASKFHNGREWDFVFDVDFEDGQPMKKICMNKDDNPYEVAEKFLLKEDLPISYKDQVVQFLMNNTRMSESARHNADPLTGGGAYVPDAPSNPSQSFSEGMGAFGEASITAVLRYSPMKSYLSFRTLKSVDPIRNKIKQFNEELKATEELKESALTDAEIEDGLNHLLSQVEAISSGSDAEVTEADLELVQKLLRFPEGKQFPALDISRYLILNADSQATLNHLIGPNFDDDQGVLADVMKRLGPHQLCGYLLSNAVSQPKPRFELPKAFPLASIEFKPATTSQSKNARVGYATFILNQSVHAFMTGKIGTESGKPELLEIAADILQDAPEDDIETIFRGLVSVGTLLYDDSGLKRLAKRTKLPSVLKTIRDRGDHSDKVKEALGDLDVILK